MNASGPCTVLFHRGEIRDAEKALYILDDGRTVAAHYVAGNDSGRFVILSTFPTNTDDNGEPRLRPDNGRPVDMSGWMLPVRRAYHVKLTRDNG